MAAEKTYTKENFLKSTKYKRQKDLLSAILKDGEGYTKKQVNKLIEGYLKGRVI